MVLNHSVGPSSAETQAEVSLYIWVISLIRQLHVEHMCGQTAARLFQYKVGFRM